MGLVCEPEPLSHHHTLAGLDTVVVHVKHVTWNGYWPEIIKGICDVKSYWLIEGGPLKIQSVFSLVSKILNYKCKVDT